MMGIFFTISIGVISMYSLLIIVYAYSWQRLKYFSPEGTPSIKISILIAARNEALNIDACLTSLCEQKYPVEQFEIIVIDDHSEDNTIAHVQALAEKYAKHRIKLIAKKEDKTTNAYKKKAIASAIEQATGELIITTDADCTMGEQWLYSIACYYEKYRPKMIAGPVSYIHDEHIFEKMQTLEFLGLIGTSAAAIQLGAPLMCNGANLAYEKKTFYEVGGFNTIDDTASGDDTFLMFKIKKQFPNGIHFIKNKEAIVFTTAKKTIAAFISQRKRWASKTTKYKDAKPVMVGIIAYFTNVILLCMLIMGVFNISMFKIFIVAFAGKCLVDGFFLRLITKFVHREILLWLLIPEQILYMLYVVYIGAIAPFSKYKWKGRLVK